jgi:hypothetical protein
MWVQPTFIGTEDQFISSWYSSGRPSALIIDQSGFLALRLDDELVAKQRDRVHPWRWYSSG